jgi:hypothetical protein
MRISCVAILAAAACAGMIACGSNGVDEYSPGLKGGPATAVPQHSSGTDGGRDGGVAISSAGEAGPNSASAGDAEAGSFGNPDVALFTLIDATTGTPITGLDPMPDGVTFDLASVGVSLSMLVQPPPVATVGCLAFALDATFTYTAETSPYSLCGSSPQGGYNPCPLTVGKHTLTVTVYPQADLGGTPYQPPTRFEFTVVDSAADAGSD